MAHRLLFHEGMVESEGILALVDKAAKRHLFPIVRGVVAIPEELAHAVIDPAFRRFDGQVEKPADEDLVELRPDGTPRTPRPKK